MIFDPYAPHASFETDEMLLPRTSVDIRVMPIDKKMFIHHRDHPGVGAIIFDGEDMIAPEGVSASYRLLYAPTNNRLRRVWDSFSN